MFSPSSYFCFFAFSFLFVLSVALRMASEATENRKSKASVLKIFLVGIVPRFICWATRELGKCRFIKERKKGADSVLYRASDGNDVAASELDVVIPETAKSQEESVPANDESDARCFEDKSVVECELREFRIGYEENGSDLCTTEDESSKVFVRDSDNSVSVSGHFPGSTLTRSDSSARSFSFPALESDWHGSPVSMAKPEPIHSLKQSDWHGSPVSMAKPGPLHSWKQSDWHGSPVSMAKPEPIHSRQQISDWHGSPVSTAKAEQRHSRQQSDWHGSPVSMAKAEQRHSRKQISDWHGSPVSTAKAERRHFQKKSDWHGNPVRKPKAERRHSRKNRGWGEGLLRALVCCKV